MTPQDFVTKYIDPWLNKSLVAPGDVWPFLALVIGYKVSPLDNRGGGWAIGRIWLGRVSNEKVFYNGLFFFRLMIMNPLKGWRVIPMNIVLWLVISAILAFVNFMFFTSVHLTPWFIFQPFCFAGMHFRWSGKDVTKREFLQTYVGWKLNGFFSAVFRVQSDDSAAEGFTSPNPNLAQGWYDGAK